MAKKNSLKESISQFACSGLVLFSSSLEIMRSHEQFNILKTSNVLVRSKHGFHLLPLFLFLTSTQFTPILVFSYFFNTFIYLFIYLWLCWVFVAVRWLSLVAASGGYSSLQCTGFLLCWLLLLQSTGSRRAGFSNCGMQAQ